jgi:hypothetical protein
MAYSNAIPNTIIPAIFSTFNYPNQLLAYHKNCLLSQICLYIGNKTLRHEFSTHNVWLCNCRYQSSLWAYIPTISKTMLPAISSIYTQPNKLSIDHAQLQMETITKIHNVILELFTTTIQSLPLIQLLIGMNPSFFTHVLSANIFFLLSANISITMFP